MTGYGVLTFSRAIVAALGLMVTGAGSVMAHSFSVGILTPDAPDKAQLISAVRGFLVASAERDGHPDETADGHVGGLDVNIVPIFDGTVIEMKELRHASTTRLDLIVSLGADDSSLGMAPGQTTATVILSPGDLPDGWFTDTGQDSFPARYRAAFGAKPDQAAAAGYNAARRIELAVRPLGGVADAAALAAALAEISDGIEW